MPAGSLGELWLVGFAFGIWAACWLFDKLKFFVLVRVNSQNTNPPPRSSTTTAAAMITIRFDVGGGGDWDW